MTDQDESARLHADTLSASLTVRDIHASLAWYRDVLGFDVDREMARDGILHAVALRAGPVRLLLNQDDGAKGLERARPTRVHTDERAPVGSIAPNTLARVSS